MGKALAANNMCFETGTYAPGHDFVKNTLK
jgi:hypothetical protein